MKLKSKIYMFLILLLLFSIGLSFSSYLLFNLAITTKIVLFTAIIATVLILSKPEKPIKIVLTDNYSINL